MSAGKPLKRSWRRHGLDAEGLAAEEFEAPLAGTGRRHHPDLGGY